MCSLIIVQVFCLMFTFILQATLLLSAFVVSLTCTATILLSICVKLFRTLTFLYATNQVRNLGPSFVGMTAQRGVNASTSSKPQTPNSKLQTPNIKLSRSNNAISPPPHLSPPALHLPLLFHHSHNHHRRIHREYLLHFYLPQLFHSYSESDFHPLIF